ncbi:hypothetical protein GOBAR_AA30535 [Gossypium barbadense]|uniref:Lariat debranching enzyme C-terminal domain-containing protein n=1 Tax=Gossypium barbadense TaxID=3634 RepID=A0A2P5WGE1_GOSBA|nr:hypothetical protein GOBAR_AA30535 [Gossypium barbadense]
MKIAVEGCMHGDLDKVYDTIKYIENTRNIKIDLLLCYGDFQEVAPVPTIFIGGNNEASNYLWELYYGGWAAPNIYFLGYAVVVKFGNIRIDGLSGIYNARHHEMPPYNDNTIRSVYHVREYDVHKLMLLEKLIDIFLSHDWPLSITDYGNWQQLIQQGTLGIKPAAQLLKKLRPSYWFSAHLHCKFTALVEHEEGGRVTKFLALNKCLPGRKFLQVGEQSSTCKIVVNGLRAGWKTEEPNLVNFLKQLHLTNPLILTFSDDYSEDIPNEDEIDLADDAERNN